MSGYPRDHYFHSSVVLSCLVIYKMEAFLQLLGLVAFLVSLLPCFSCAGGEFDIRTSKIDLLVLKGGDRGHLPMSYNMIIMTLL